mgnify:CR=1 FL=1
MMNKYLKSHITAAAFCAGRVLFHFPRTADYAAVYAVRPS